jgi:two-component system alkaline phosphatase synthesis response regulator PhoP
MDKNNIKVLLVDDEADILEFLSYNLKHEGFQVFTAKNGKEGIEKASNILPQLIIVDVLRFVKFLNLKAVWLFF